MIPIPARCIWMVRPRLAGRHSALQLEKLHFLTILYSRVYIRKGTKCSRQLGALYMKLLRKGKLHLESTLA